MLPYKPRLGFEAYHCQESQSRLLRVKKVLVTWKTDHRKSVRISELDSREITLKSRKYT